MIESAHQYKKLNDTFACIGEVNGKEIAIEYLHIEDQLRFEDFFDFLLETDTIDNIDEGPVKLETLNENAKMLYFASVCIITAENNDNTIIALALGSYSKYVETFQKILYFALLDYIKSSDGKQVIVNLYDAFSNLNLEYKFYFKQKRAEAIVY